MVDFPMRHNEPPNHRRALRGNVPQPAFGLAPPTAHRNDGEGGNR